MKKYVNSKFLNIMIFKIIIILMFSCIILAFSTVSFISNAVQIDTNSIADRTVEIDTNLGKIIIEAYNTTLNKSKKVVLKLYTTGENIVSLYGQLKYDEEIFEKLNFDTDIETISGWGAYEGEKDENGTEIYIYPERSEYACSDQLIATIQLTVKKSTDDTKILYNNLVISNIDYDDSLDEEGYGKSTSINFVGTSEEIVEPTPDPAPAPNKSLYLSSDIYKIGNNDIKNYENGDKYISRVVRETTKREYINNLKTNGTIRILKKDDIELEDDEIIGTGMTLEIMKDDEKIRLQISVMGDLNGDGKVTATDLSTLNQKILQLIMLKDEHYVAADLDENNKITATDLSTENQMILKLI